MKYALGIAGLAVMGENLVLNMESKGFPVAVYNRTFARTEKFLAGRARGKNIGGFKQIADFVQSLEPPRKIMMMLKAGEPVDQFIEQLLPYLDKGDIIIDGGNSHYHDTVRRLSSAESRGLRYIGTGVSGGEEGALKGPSLMPGGSKEAWPLIKPIFQAISAKVGPNHDIPCCEWVGPRGAGHYVKMVHNGIEYGDMQLIGESYWLMKNLLGLEPPALHEVFARWNAGPLESYLIEITRDIFGFKDPETGKKETFELPESRYGLVFVFRVFDRVSYGLVVDASSAVHIADTVRTP